METIGQSLKFVAIFVLSSLPFTTTFAASSDETTSGIYVIHSKQKQCVFDFVKSTRAARYQHAELLVPSTVYSNEIGLDEYQKEFQSFQNFTPEFFLNYFNALTEVVYLYVGLDRYKAPRSPLDSLAHEFVHFFQFIESDRNPNLHKEDYNDDLENEAVRIQTQFRDTQTCL